MEQKNSDDYQNEDAASFNSLRVAMTQAADIIDRNLYHQREKVADAASILRAALSASEVEQSWRLIETAPKDGTHIIGLTQFGAREIWWHRDYYEGEFWQDEGDSEPEPTHWVPMPRSAKSRPSTEVEKISTDTEETERRAR